jgi:putative transposase
VAVRWSRPVAVTIKTVTITREADGWYVSFACMEVPVAPLPLTGRETGIDVGLRVFLVTADGDMLDNPRHQRQAEQRRTKAQQRAARRQRGSKRRAKAARQCAKRDQHVRRRRDFHYKTALALAHAYDTICVEAIQTANVGRRTAPKAGENGTYEHNGAATRPASTRLSETPDGPPSSPSSRSRQQAPGSEWKRSSRRTRRRMVQAATHACRSP